jgi:UDP-glucose 4-epimerase
VTTVLVTGGAGFIGSHLADRLLAEGYRVISVDDLTTGRIANLAEGRNYGKEFTFFNMDVRSDGVQQLFERHRPEIVFHLAAQSGVRPSLEDPSRDAASTSWAAERRGVLPRRLGVRQGRVRVLPAARSTGEPTKLPVKDPASTARGSHVRRTASRRRSASTTSPSIRSRAGIDFTALAASERVRPRQDPARRGRRGLDLPPSKMLAGESPTVYGDGNQTRDYVFIDDDVCTALALAVDRGPASSSNIGTGLETSRQRAVPGCSAEHRRVRRRAAERTALRRSRLRRIALDKQARAVGRSGGTPGRTWRTASAGDGLVHSAASEAEPSGHAA